MTEPVPRPESFKAVERRIAITRKRLPKFPHEHATLSRLLAHTHKRMQDSSNAALKAHALSYVTYNTLMMMYGTEDYTISPSELAEATGEKPTNITRICDELVERKLIARRADLEDRRRVVLTLTAKGRQLVEAVQPSIWAALGEMYRGFSVTEMQQFGALLKRVLLSLESQR